MECADVITIKQMTDFKRLESLVRSAQIIRNAPIFTCRVTQRVTQKSAPFSLAESITAHAMSVFECAVS
jgi:hypothetical protein